jgi:hypothetical protein
VALAFELQADSVVYEPFAIESLREIERPEQTHRTVLEHSGA